MAFIGLSKRREIMLGDVKYVSEEKEKKKKVILNLQI